MTNKVAVLVCLSLLSSIGGFAIAQLFLYFVMLFQGGIEFFDTIEWAGLLGWLCFVLLLSWIYRYCYRHFVVV